ncbi:MAG: alpha/beta hydrolase [Bacteroidales bacterium]|nr:alpha/beta hydrolase [Bacteroidales bacterium]
MIKREELHSDNCTISYFQSREDGIPVILIHEILLGAATYHEVFKGDLAKKYRLISFDFPGHGESSYSDKPFEDYSLPGLVGLLKKIIRHLHAENAIFVGNGFGGNILLEAINELPWLRAICIFNTPILSTLSDVINTYFKHPIYDQMFSGEPFNEEAGKIANSFIHKKYATQVEELIKKVDYRFGKYFGNWIKSGEFINYKELLRYNQWPMAIFHGSDDKIAPYEIINKIKMENLWKKKVQTIPYSMHLPQLENSNVFSDLLGEFIFEITGV